MQYLGFYFSSNTQNMALKIADHTNSFVANVGCRHFSENAVIRVRVIKVALVALACLTIFNSPKIASLATKIASVIALSALVYLGDKKTIEIVRYDHSLYLARPAVQ
jgi:hypothetical protein